MHPVLVGRSAFYIKKPIIRFDIRRVLPTLQPASCKTQTKRHTIFGERSAQNNRSKEATVKDEEVEEVRGRLEVHARGGGFSKGSTEEEETKEEWPREGLGEHLDLGF